MKLKQSVTSIMRQVRNVAVGVAGGAAIVEAATDVPNEVHAAAGIVLLCAHVVTTSIDDYTQAANGSAPSA